MITTEKIKIFDRYDGNIDGFARSGREHEKKLLDDDEWSVIDNLHQDIELINKRLAAQTYVAQTLIKLKENCDLDSFAILTSKIESYKDFQKVSEILKHIESYTNADSETGFSSFESTKQFLDDLNQDIINIENCDFSTLGKVNIEFLPTSTYQEISISNGWSETYIKLSKDFDELFKKLIERKTEQNNTLPKVGRKWLQKFFGS